MSTGGLTDVSRIQTASLRADDHSTIGGILFAVLTPALFWKRANAINCTYGKFSVWSFTHLPYSDTRRRKRGLFCRSARSLREVDYWRSRTSGCDAPTTSNRGTNIGCYRVFDK